MPAKILSVAQSASIPTLNSFTIKCSKYFTSGKTEQTDAIHVCHQQKPRLKSCGWNRSPFHSQESRWWWARWNLLPLLALHVHRPPTSFLTVKWSDQIPTGWLSKFWKKLGNSVRCFNKRNGELRFYAVLEINRHDVLHAHLLVRSELATDVVADLLGSKVGRFSDGLAAVAYCEEVHSDAAVSRYSLKFIKDVRTGEKEVLLFEKGLAKLTTQSCYFKPWKVPDLRKEGRAIERLQREKWQCANCGQFPATSFVLDRATEGLVSRFQPGSTLLAFPETSKTFLDRI